MQDELEGIVKSIRKYIELEELAGTGEFLGERRAAPVPAETLEGLKKEALSCTKCDLCETRTHVVFGAGNPRAKLMFVGEAPGMQEDLQGLPFLGRAGKLLTKIIESI